MITSYYTTKLGLEPETIAYRDRVLAEPGAEVIDLAYVDSVYKKLKNLNLLSTLKHWTSYKAGIKRDGNNSVSKMYSFIATSDKEQTDASKQPIYTINGINYDGSQFMFLNSDIQGRNVSVSFDLAIDSYDVSGSVLFGSKASSNFWQIRRKNEVYVSGLDRKINIDTTNFNDGIFRKINFIGSTSQILFYTDNKIIGSRAVSSLYIPSGTQYFEVGRYQGGTTFDLNGRIKTFHLFEKVLTQSEITELNAL